MTWPIKFEVFISSVRYVLYNNKVPPTCQTEQNDGVKFYIECVLRSKYSQTFSKTVLDMREIDYTFTIDFLRIIAIPLELVTVY